MDINLDLAQYLVHHQPTQHVERMLWINILKFYIRKLSSYQNCSISVAVQPFKNCFNACICRYWFGGYVSFSPNETSHRKLKMLNLKNLMSNKMGKTYVKSLVPFKTLYSCCFLVALAKKSLIDLGAGW